MFNTNFAICLLQCGIYTWELWSFWWPMWLMLALPNVRNSGLFLKEQGRDWLSESSSDSRKMHFWGSGRWFWTERLFQGTARMADTSLHLPWRTWPGFDSVPGGRICEWDRVFFSKIHESRSCWCLSARLEVLGGSWGCVWPREMWEINSLMN